MGKNRIKLSLIDTDLVLLTDDDEGYVREIAAKLDKRLRDLMQENPRLSVTMAAMLCALNSFDEAMKAKDNADNLRSQIKEYLEDSSRSRMQSEESRREIERMKREIQTLRMRLAETDKPQDSAAAGPATPAVQTRLYAKPQPLNRPLTGIETQEDQ